MAEAKEHMGSLGAAGTALRETAKWLAGGIFATAAGIFAGSSLTKLGSLDFDSYPVRLPAAIAGAFLGFAALGFLFQKVIAVLTTESVNFEMLVAGEADPSNPLHDVASAIAKKYLAYSGGPGTLAAFLAQMQALDPASRELGNAADTVDIINADAGFLAVNAKFKKLTAAIPAAGILAIIGFGLFAWAANPPEPKEKPKDDPPARTINFTVQQAPPAAACTSACCCHCCRCRPHRRKKHDTQPPPNNKAICTSTH